MAQHFNIDDALSAVAGHLSSADIHTDMWMVAHDQFIEIVSELMASAILSAQNGEISSDEMEHQIYNSWWTATEFYSILRRVEGFQNENRKSYINSINQLPINKRKNIRYTPCLPWSKRDPMDEFRCGIWSKTFIDMTSLDNIAISGLAESYVDRKSISPTLEYILLDILFYAECRHLGDDIKESIFKNSDKQKLERSVTDGEYSFMIDKKIKKFNRAAFIIFVSFIASYYMYDPINYISIISVIIFYSFYAQPFSIMRDKILEMFGIHTFPMPSKREKMSLFQKMTIAHKKIARFRPPEVIIGHLQQLSNQGGEWNVWIDRFLVRAAQRDRETWGKATGEHRVISRKVAWKIREMTERPMEREARYFLSPAYDGG